MHPSFVKPPQHFANPAVFLVLAGLSLSASAFQPLITDDTGTQGADGNQIEFSFNEDRSRMDGNTDRTRAFPVVYTRGLTDSIDVFAGFSYIRIRSGTPGGDASGGGNPAIGAKWRFYENDESKTSLAIKPVILYPVSSSREREGLGTGKTSGSLTLILTQEVPFGAVHVNAGVIRDLYRDTLNNPNTTTTRASIAPVWDVSERWKLALDLGTESARSGGSSVRTDFVELGAIYAPSKDLDFALGFVRSSDNDSPHTTTNTATAGVTWRFQ